jgi:hypothetical protein
VMARRPMVMARHQRAPRALVGCRFQVMARHPMVMARHQRAPRALVLATLLVLPAVTAMAMPDYSVLTRRVNSLQSEEAAVTCLLVDTMVPRQRLNLQFGPPMSTALSRARESGGQLVCIGMDQRRGELLRHGVEVRIESMSPYVAAQGYFSAHSTRLAHGYTAMDTTLVAGRRCELLDTGDLTWPPNAPFFDATVRWLEDEAVPTAASIAQAEKLAPLVAEWLERVRATRRAHAPRLEPPSLGHATRVCSGVLTVRVVVGCVLVVWLVVCWCGGVLACAACAGLCWAVFVARVLAVRHACWQASASRGRWTVCSLISGRCLTLRTPTSAPCGWVA